MNLIKKILDRFSGLSFRQEYICLERPIDHSPRLVLFNGEHSLKDVTTQHVFSGYSPLIFSFPSFAGDGSNWPAKIRLYLFNDLSNRNATMTERDALAWLELEKICKQTADGIEVYHYHGTNGRHLFLSDFQQRMMLLSNNWFSKKKDNVYLDASLLRQVQVAYAFPRNISLATVEKQGLYNLFPTDLHGPLGEHYYLDSLRQGGMALRQVMEAGRMLITEITPSEYKRAFYLGKNHMRPLSSKDQFPFSVQNSPVFGLPIPPGAVRIREVELVNSVPAGIHQLLLFRVRNNQHVGESLDVLTHIHSVYATWRKKQGLGGNYLLR